MINPFKDYKELLEKYLHKETIPFLENAWHEPHRKYHSINHLKEILEYLKKHNSNVHPVDYDSLLLTAFFHDCYYNPRDNKNNEDESIKRFLSSFKDDHNYRIKNAVIEMIEATKYRKKPNAYLTRIFWEADNSGFCKGYEHLLKNEKLIRQEFIHIPKKIYKKKRVDFLKTNIGLFNSLVDRDLNKLINYIKAL